MSLPVTLPKDEGTEFVDQNAARSPEYPFEPLFRAAAFMNPSFRFDHVDVLVNRNSLRKLLDLSAGRRQESFRLNLYLVHRTLVIERCEKNARRLIHGSLNPGWGRMFEKRFAKYPPGLEDSASHHRALQYELGALTCVVRSEVDASYEEGPRSGELSDLLPAMIDSLVIEDSPASKNASRKPLMAQSTAAEMMTASQDKRLGLYLPQLWFGRTPWLVMGRHSNGTFQEIRITHAEPRFTDWESRRQVELRKLATILTQLRKAVEENRGEHCIAIHQKIDAPSGIRVFPALVSKEAVSTDFRRDFWDCEPRG